MPTRTYDVITSPDHKPIKMWSRGVDIEDDAVDQIIRTASLPFIFRHIAVMPDAHWGLGSTVGTIVATQGAVIPAAVGADIGCGVASVKLKGLKFDHLPKDLYSLRHDIERAIPTGRFSHKHTKIATQEDKMNARGIGIDHFLDFVENRHEGIAYNKRGKNAILGDIITTQFGTLGGGNHFIEVCVDEDEDIWITLHSGSRNIGKRISDYFIDLAKSRMSDYHLSLPDPDLAFLPVNSRPVGNSDFMDYIGAMRWAQQYAAANREEMLDNVVDIVHRHCNEAEYVRSNRINCAHNFAAVENHFGKNILVTRKGATRARDGEWAIIPGSMGTKTYIVRGKGNPDSFHSCSHGAGRSMSRREAKRRFTVQDHIEATGGVECRKDVSVLDETPMAYKPIDDVMLAQRDLVEVMVELMPAISIKG